VRNARAVGKVEIRRAGRSEMLRIEEVASDQSAPVLQQYLKRVPAGRPFFAVTPDSPLDDFVSEASRHPVFRLMDEQPGGTAGDDSRSRGLERDPPPA
jgi:hypothetical protein